MDEIESKNDKREQIALSNEASKKIDHWIDQAETKCNVRLSRRAMLNWYILKSPENLSQSEITNISRRFYDTEKHLKSLIRKIRKAKEDGDISELEVVVKQRKNESRKDVDTNANSSEQTELPDL